MGEASWFCWGAFRNQEHFCDWVSCTLVSRWEEQSGAKAVIRKERAVIIRQRGGLVIFCGLDHVLVSFCAQIWLEGGLSLLCFINGPRVALSDVGWCSEKLHLAGKYHGLTVRARSAPC